MSCMCDFKEFEYSCGLVCVCLCVCVDVRGATKALPLSSTKCCCVDASVRWHFADILLPLLYHALQKQQVQCKVKLFMIVKKHPDRSKLLCHVTRIVKMSSPNLNVLTLFGSVLTYISGFLFAVDERASLQDGTSTAVLQVSVRVDAPLMLHYGVVVARV